MWEEIIFNTNDKHFEPTDILRIEKGQQIAAAFKNSEYAFLLQHQEILETVLNANGLTLEQILARPSREILLRLNHPNMYKKSNCDHPGFQAYRNRSFEFLEANIASTARPDILMKIRAKLEKKSRVLDVGCGSGRSIIEVQKKFPNARAYGICLPGERENLKRVSDFFNLSNAKSVAPKVFEADLNHASLLDFTGEKFDFAYSQATLRYVCDKLAVIEDVWKALKPGGIAALEISLLFFEDLRGRTISLDDFFNQKKWQGMLFYDQGSRLLFLFKSDVSEIGFSAKLLSKKSKYCAPKRLPQKNSEVGWSSVYQACHAERARTSGDIISASIGDAYLYRNNQIFKKMRRLTLKHGFRFVDQSTIPGYSSAPLIFLPLILKTRTIPYHSNRLALKALRKSMPMNFDIYATSASLILPNFVLHESAHALAEIVWKSQYHRARKGRNSTDRKIWLVLRVLFGEACANATEVIASAATKSSKEARALEFNSYLPPTAANLGLISQVRELQNIFGSAAAFKMMIVFFMFSNLLAENISKAVLLGIGMGILGYSPTPRALASMESSANGALKLNPQFRRQTALAFFQMAGLEGTIDEIVRPTADFLKTELAIFLPVISVYAEIVSEC